MNFNLPFLYSEGDDKDEQPVDATKGQSLTLGHCQLSVFSKYIMLFM